MKNLWLLPILFLISAPAFAAPLPYDIYAYWNIDELTMVFNGVAAIIGDSNFLGLIKTVMFVGALVAMFSFLGKKQFDGWNWFLGAMFIYTLLFLPVGTVVIQDRTGSKPPQTAGNIPVALAAMASLSSHGGDYMTRGFEAVFSVLPDDLKFQGHGLGFGHRILKESRRMTIADPELKADVIQFIKNCTNYDIMQGRIAYQDVYSGFDPWNTMWLNTSTAHMTMYRSFSGAKTGYCSEVAVGGANVAVNDSLKFRLDAAVDAAQKYYGRVLNPDVTDENIAGALLASQMPNAFQVMLGMSQSASDLIKQNMFINIWQESGSAIPQMLGDTASVQAALASAQAAAAANSSYKVTASLSEHTMPMFRNVIELIIYAMFPFIIVFAVAAGNTSGPILKGYFMGMIWVQLWAPIYAVVNLVGTMFSAGRLKAIAMAANGLAIQTAGALDEGLISHQAAMGFLAAVAVPTIAYYLAKGATSIDGLNSSLGKMTAPVESAAGQFGSAVGLGSASQGQMNIDTIKANMQSMNQYDRSGSLTQKDATGTRQWDMDRGEYRQTDNLGKSPITAASSKQISMQHARSASELESVSRTDAKAAEQSMAASLNDTLSAARSTSVQDQKGQGWGAGKTGSHSTQAQVVNEVTDRLAKETGISDTKKLETAVSASLVTSASAGIGGKLGPVSLGAEIQAQLKAEGKAASSHDISKAIKRANDTLAKHGITSADGVVSDYRNSDEFKHLQTSDRQAADRIDSGVQTANTYRESSTVNHQKAKEHRATAQRAETLSATMSVDDTVAINNIRAKMGLAQEHDPRKLEPVIEKYLETYKPYYGPEPTPLVPGNDLARAHAGTAPGAGKNGMIDSPEYLKYLEKHPEEKYRNEFDAATPGAGQAGVSAASRENNAKVTARNAGLNPNSTVGDGGVKRRVEAGQRTADAAVAQEGGSVANERKAAEGRWKAAQNQRPGAK